MSKSNLPARMFGGTVARQDRKTTEELSAIQREMFVERARDAAERDLTILKISDIGHVGRHGMAEAADLANCVTAYADANPASAKAVSELAETAVRGMERRLRRLTEEG